MKKPVSPDDLQNPELRVELAPHDAVDALGPYVDRIMSILEELIGFESIWITDETCVGDFVEEGARRDEVFEQLQQRLGLALDQGNEDDQFIVRIAQRLKQLAQA